VFNAWLLGLLVILVVVTLLWLLSLQLRDSGIVDIFWGTGFIIAAITYVIAQPDGASARQILVLVLVILWGGRLSLHLARRNLGKDEDFRYAAWRRQFGSRWWWWSWFQVFGLQGVLLWIISLPLLAAAGTSQPGSLTVVDFLGAGVWLVGWLFESVGDWQLMRFKANPDNRGKVLDSGLWRYTRHPNYFGDAVVWWGFAIIALGIGAWWALIGPVLMTWLLVRVSGVAMLESTLKKTKPQYVDYVRRTSAFVPMPPKEI
jgi:steroid 5-alpha reductase family enzyme